MFYLIYLEHGSKNDNALKSGDHSENVKTSNVCDEIFSELRQRKLALGSSQLTSK